MVLAGAEEEEGAVEVRAGREVRTGRTCGAPCADWPPGRVATSWVAGESVMTMMSMAICRK
jgi:hypothetical protein